MAPWSSNSSIWVQRSAVPSLCSDTTSEPEAALGSSPSSSPTILKILKRHRPRALQLLFCRHGCAGKAKKLPLLGSLPWYLTMNPFHHDLPSPPILIFSRFLQTCVKFLHFLLHLHLFRDVPTISFLDTTFRRMFLSFSRKASFFCPNPTRLPRATQALNEAQEPGNQLFQRNRQGR